MMVTIKQFEFNPLEVRSSLIYDTEGIGVLVDPAMMFDYEFDELSAFVEQHKIKVNYLMITHGHFDHVLGIKKAKEMFKCPLLAHPGDELFISHAPEQARALGFPEIEQPTGIDQYLNDGETLEVGDINIEVLHVPGHSPGSIAFYLKEVSTVVAGDVLFAGGIGRTDLPGGDHDQILNSIRTRLFTLPPETIVISGHGPNTTIETEQNSNPFLD
jgi:glyoxylase-like metal-dependent hydrolase (beta-lactamase superfamily II)